MRVALVAPYDLAVPGGVQRQVLGLAAALAEGGDAVLLVGPGSPATWAGGLAGVGGGRLEAVGVGPTLAVPANGSRAPVARSPLAGARTRGALARFRPEVVHVHEPFVPGPALAAARARAAPTVLTFHRSGAGAGYRLAGPLLAPVARAAAHRVAVSEEAAATLATVLGAASADVEIVPNAVDLTLAAAGRAEPIAGEGPTVAFVGRQEPRKGLEVLLAAFEQLGGGATLWVVGDGPLRRRLEARHGGGAIRFLGRVDDQELARRVAGADVLVAPSLGGESFGLVLLEAMAAGTAVVASDLPGYRRAAGEAARFVPAGDAVALAEALSALLADETARRALVERGLERVAGAGFDALAAAYRERYAGGSPRPRAVGP